MEDRFSEKFTKYSPPISSQSVYLQSEVQMLEERLKNLDYLKQTYERNSKEKTLEIESLLQELSEYKSELYVKNRKIEEMQITQSNNESTLLKVLDEHRVNKMLLEEEITKKTKSIQQLERNLQEQYENSLKVIDENRELRKEMKEKEIMYNEHIYHLEEKLREINGLQKITEEKVNNLLFCKTPQKKKVRLRREETGKINQMYKKELAINKSLKNIITDMYKQKPEKIEERLMKSEKKLKEIEDMIASTSKNSLSSPMTTLKNSAKLRSSSQSIRNRSNKY